MLFARCFSVFRPTFNVVRYLQTGPIMLERLCLFNKRHIMKRDSLFRSFHSSNSRYSVSSGPQRARSNKSTVYYVVALGVLTVGFSYAAVPLYRLFCQVWVMGLSVYCLFCVMLLVFSSLTATEGQHLPTMT